MGIFTRSRNKVDGREKLPAVVPSQASLITGLNQWGDVLLPSVTSNDVLGLAAAFRAVNLIANGVATCSPMRVYAADDITELDVPPVVSRPIPEMQTFDYFHQVVTTLLLHGNFYGVLADYDAQGFPQQVIPAPTGFVSISRDGDGFLRYDIGGEPYSSDEILHLKLFSIPGALYGLGVVANFRRAMGAALDQQNMAADTYKSGAVPPGIITLDQSDVTKDQAAAVQAQWITGHGNGLRRPAVLSKKMTFQPISWNPEDAQFLQSRQFSVAEIAMMFNLDPSDLGAAVGGTSLTYANIEQRSVARVTDSYGPIMRRIEEAFSDLIPGKRHAVFDVEKLLRTDSKTRAEVHELNIATGLETVSEARASEHKAPLPPSAESENEPAKPPGALLEPTAPGVADAKGAPAAAAPTKVTPPVPPQPVGAPDLQVTPMKVKI